jgi:hypothetical protein
MERVAHANGAETLCNGRLVLDTLLRGKPPREASLAVQKDVDLRHKLSECTLTLGAVYTSLGRREKRWSEAVAKFVDILTSSAVAC